MKKSQLKEIITECVRELNEGDNQRAFDQIESGLIELDSGIDKLEDKKVATQIRALREKIGKIVRKLPGYM